ncbi:hypothetical protein LEAN103870_05045 [Legionella anisa]|uniref:Uncharacterized protein n=1 Tax=Legionella anisa TaxID=28082 RepID=A0AAX0WT65_9GAMM|nr:hypothetical protein [Legionella anisa]AWN73141.1 hypothetical protein DLD14_04405 [Legionella anisa]KTC67424.1 hypothetical protein Lani_3769 [Legionella anisa]MCW8423971.1 hypothetical protein [Legionella anisa]MCW8447493.1 hypothetical protein [Legionella anisa]PNL60259.1 hypothetical protein A6J39_002995 [Legionella anisa]
MQSKPEYNVFENDIDNLMLNNLANIQKSISLAMQSGAELPPSAADIVFIIDRLNENLEHLNQLNLTVDMTPTELEFARLNHIKNTVIFIDILLKSESKVPAYEELYKRLQVASESGLILLMHVVEKEIQLLEKNHLLLRKADESYLVSLISFVKEMQLAVQFENSSLTKLCEFRERLFDIHNKFLEAAARDDLKDLKEESFFEKRINPYLDYLIQNQSVVSEATQDLEIIIKAIMQEIKNNNPNVTDMFRVNCLNEIEVTVGQEVYNLTQILKHEPNFNQINLTEDELESYLSFLQNDPSIVLKPVAFPVVNWKSDDSKTIMKDLDDQLKDENYFQECHSSECLAINIYTTDAYVPINMLLREKMISTKIFEKGSTDKNVQDALFRLEMLLTGQATQDEITPTQQSQLILEALLATVCAVRGINKAQHLCYVPDDQVTITGDLLDTHQGRSIRATSGTWVAAEKRRFELAKEAGIPLYYAGFTSTSFDTSKVGTFIADPNTALITKTHPWSGISKYSIGAIIKALSQYPTEAEYIFPPCLCLPQEEKQIKRPDHYGKLQQDKKVAMVLAHGNSPKSMCYSTQIQKIRGELIKQLDYVNKSNTQNDPTLTRFSKHIEELIHKLDTQLKTIKLISLQEGQLQGLKQKIQQKGLKGVRLKGLEKVDGVFFVSEATRTLVFINQRENLFKEFQLSPQQFDKIDRLLNLQVEKDKNLTHLEIVLMQKLTGLTMEPINDPEFTAKCYQEEIESILGCNPTKPVSIAQFSIFAPPPQAKTNQQGAPSIVPII